MATKTSTAAKTSTASKTSTRTATSTKADTKHNFTATVTGGAGRGATTTVNIMAGPQSSGGKKSLPKGKSSGSKHPSSGGSVHSGGVHERRV